MDEGREEGRQEGRRPPGLAAGVGAEEWGSAEPAARGGGPGHPWPPAGCGGRPSAGRAAGAAPRSRPRSGTRGLLTCVGAGVPVRPARGVRFASGVIVAGESGSGGRAF